MLDEVLMASNKPKSGRFVDIAGKILNSGSLVLGCCGTKNNRAEWLILCKCGKEYKANTLRITGKLAETCFQCKKQPLIDNKINTSFGNNCKILAHDHTETMKNGKPRQYFKVQCHCGHIWVTCSWNRINECQACAHLSSAKGISGENHWNYNPDLTDEERLENRRHSINRKIREKVISRDSNQCQLCQTSENLIYHHLNGWDHFPEQRQSLDNILTLCETCHNEFHDKYGRGDNTKEQFKLFQQE